MAQRIILSVVLLLISISLCNGIKSQIKLSDSFDDPDGLVVNTKNGPLKGIYESGLRVFRGIPYGESTSGTQRWKAPQAKKSWAPTIFDATHFGHCCPQPPLGQSDLTYDEDCLHLNVWAPPVTPKVPLPTMVFIHGGEYVVGCSAENSYHGDYIANSSDVVMVSINYRLGALGFLYDSKIFGGNFGIMDQILALKWVQDNIIYFGGDPNNVTIFGQSAGAMSIAIHLTSPASYSNHYFHKAILESDPVTLQYRSPSEMEPYVEKFSKLLNCDPSDAKCLSSKSVSEIVDAQGKVYVIPWKPSHALTALPWIPVVDGYIVPDQPLNLFEKGNFYQVPTILGFVKNETATFAELVLDAFGFTKGLNKWEYELFVGVFFDIHAFKVLELYPAGDNPFYSLIRMTTDYLFVCPGRRVASAIAKSNSPTFFYTFMHDSESVKTPICMNGSVCHSAELRYVFHSFFIVNPHFRVTPEELDLSWNMLDYWTSFAKTNWGTSPPNKPIQWPAFNSDATQVMSFDLKLSTLSGFKRKECDYFDSIGYDY